MFHVGQSVQSRGSEGSSAAEGLCRACRPHSRNTCHPAPCLAQLRAVCTDPPGRLFTAQLYCSDLSELCPRLQATKGTSALTCLRGF